MWGFQWVTDLVGIERSCLGDDDGQSDNQFYCAWYVSRRNHTIFNLKKHYDGHTNITSRLLRNTPRNQYENWEIILPSARYCSLFLYIYTKWEHRSSPTKLALKQPNNNLSNICNIWSTHNEINKTTSMLSI